MTMPLRGADIIAQSLARLGCRHVFTLSGNHIMPMFDAALEAGVELIHVRHEAAAVHMADAWARLTGEVGVALVTGGPGHANAVGALYTAAMAESPVVLLSGHAPIAQLGMGATVVDAILNPRERTKLMRYGDYFHVAVHDCQCRRGAVSSREIDIVT